MQGDLLSRLGHGTRLFVRKTVIGIIRSQFASRVVVRVLGEGS